jgi:hypothetical protein
MVSITIPQPKAAELYYDTCGKIDQHNRDRQATLGIEVKLKTQDWLKRVGLTILAMCIVDSWKVWSRITMDAQGNAVEKHKQYYAHLAAELIDNDFDGVRRRSNNATPDSQPQVETILRNPRTGEVRHGLDIHLTPTGKVRNKEGSQKKFDSKDIVKNVGKKQFDLFRM